MTGPVPVTVVVPTVGRDLLARCLGSLLACRPAAGEIVVVDQGAPGVVAGIVASLEAPSVRIVTAASQGIAAALNAGLAQAAHDAVLVTHDDCTVAPDWVASAAAARTDDARIVTGRVLPGSDAGVVPSTITSTEPRVYDSPRAGSVLYPNNMGLSARAALSLGGFDERFTTAAEDNDFCYRWLRSGRVIEYAPALVVWHHDWRTSGQLRRLYRRYWIAQGAFYAKHLRLGDRDVWRFVRWDVAQAVRAGLAGTVRREPSYTDERRGALTALPVGLVKGWRSMAPRERDAHAPR